MPDRTFMADEGTNPVTGLAVAQHRVAIYSTLQHMLDRDFQLFSTCHGFVLTLASRDQVVRLVLLKRREADVRDGPGMAMARQRDILPWRIGCGRDRRGLGSFGRLGLGRHREERGMNRAML